MPEHNIKPLYPVTPATTVLKKKPSAGKKNTESSARDRKKKEGTKKGIIDTYA